MSLWSRLLNLIYRDSKGTRNLDDAMSDRWTREHLDKGFQAWSRSTDPQDPPWRD